MFNRDALDALTEALSIQNVAMDETYEPTVLVPRGMEVRSLETYLERPLRRRAKLLTSRIEDFARYVNSAKQDGTIIFIDPECGSAEAVIDYGTHERPEWGDHKVTLKIPRTEEAKAVIGINERAVSQRELIEFLEDWRAIIAPQSASGDNVSVTQAIGAIRSVKIDEIRETQSTQGDFESSVSVLDQVSAKGVSESLPSFLRATFSIREGLDPVQVELKVSILTERSDEPMFKLRAIALQSIMHDSARHIESAILDAVEGVETFIGSL